MVSSIWRKHRTSLPKPELSQVLWRFTPCRLSMVYTTRYEQKLTTVTYRLCACKHRVVVVCGVTTYVMFVPHVLLACLRLQILFFNCISDCILNLTNMLGLARDFRISKHPT